MKRNPTILALFSLLASLFCSQSSATIYVDNGSSATYTLNPGDSLNIASGIFTGTINGFPAGAKISVASGAVFQPVSMDWPNLHGTLDVYGTFKMTSPLHTNTGFILNNYGTVWVTSTTQMSGSSQVWTNYFNALIKLDGDVSMTNDNSIINHGTITCGANLTMTGSTSITNESVLTVAGNYLNSGGTFTNDGRFQTTGSMTFNNGQAIIINNCRMISEGGINNTSGFVYNYAFMWAKASRGFGDIVNSGTITNGPIARIKSVTFNNTGTVNGAGYLYFTGNTSTTASGTTGVTGITTDTIKIYDVTRTNPSTIYDNQTGTVNPNVVYQAFAAPDSNLTYIQGCSVEIIAQIPLAVNWNYFFVAMSDNVPSLNWSAQYDRGTIFEIQRSYDGKSFYSIKNITADNSKSVYSFNDEQVNTKSMVVYYRIKADEPNGAEKYSETRTVKFSNKPGVTIQTAPNPFTSDFNINYQTTENGMITIRVFNLNGQQQLIKNVVVNNGFNSITIIEAARLVKGMYMVQVSSNNKLISTEKIIKQ
jgi:Secretion system C-terminal sorting domain